MEEINIDNTSYFDTIKYTYVVPEINDLFVYICLCVF